MCHNDVAGVTLGLRTEQVNLGNQLERWNELQLFDRDIRPLETYRSYSSLEDASKNLNTRARSYLAVNCAVCHQPYGPAPGGMDMRFSTSTENMNVIGVDPTEYDLGIPNAKRVFPGDKDKSIIFERIRDRGEYQMPPIHLGSERVDMTAIRIIGAWIDEGVFSDEISSQPHSSSRNSQP